MIEEDRRLLKTSQPVLGYFRMCCNCEKYVEDYTGKEAKAIRQVTPEGTCSVCGSFSLVKLPEHVWPWQKREY